MARHVPDRARPDAKPEEPRISSRAATTAGVGRFTIILRHIVPNLLGIVVVYATLLVPLMILVESFISFLGLGVAGTQYGHLAH